MESRCSPGCSVVAAASAACRLKESNSRAGSQGNRLRPHVLIVGLL